MKRTKEEQRLDDRESVRSNINALGAAGALAYAAKHLPEMQPPHVRRMHILTIRQAARELRLQINSATRLARCHAVGLRTLGVKVALLLAVALPAMAQEARPTKVYTNVIDGRAYRQTIVAVVRLERPAAPVPASLPGTPLPPPRWRPEIGGTGYVPPARPAAAVATRTAPPPQPWYVNGVYVGPSPSGLWTATAIGRPVVDVNIVGTPARPK